MNAKSIEIKTGDVVEIVLGDKRTFVVADDAFAEKMAVLDSIAGKGGEADYIAKSFVVVHGPFAVCKTEA